MRFSQIAQRIEELRPKCNASEIALMSILTHNAHEADHVIENDKELGRLIQDITLRLKQNSDQHAAVSEELTELARSDPKEFKKEQIWTLIRAINVQDQLLQLYAGLEPLDA